METKKSIQMLMPVTFTVNENIAASPITVTSKKVIDTLQQCVIDRLTECRERLMAAKDNIHSIDKDGIYYLEPEGYNIYSFKAVEAMERFIAAKAEEQETSVQFLKRFDAFTLEQVIKAYEKAPSKSELIYAKLFDVLHRKSIILPDQL